MNPIVFVATVLLIELGRRMRILTQTELAISGGLLVIPYVARAYEMAFNSQARFCLVVFPAYIVAGSYLARWPTCVCGAILLVLAGGLGTYSYLFSSGRPFF